MGPSTAVVLLVAVTVTIQFVLPLGVWLSYRRRPNRSAQLWLCAMIFWFCAGAFAGLRPWLPRFWGHEFVWISTGLAFPIMVDVLRQDFGRKAFCWAFYVGLTLLLSVLALWSNLAQLPIHYGFVWMSTYIPVFAFYLVYLSGQHRRKFGEKSLVLIQLAFMAYGVAALPRLFDFILSGDAGRMDIFQFGAAANIFAFVAIVGPIFLSLGHWIYTLERTDRERTTAELGREKAEESEARLRQVLAQRDRLLLLNSRMSGVSMISSFAGMLVHELSDFLQILRLNLATLRERFINDKGRELVPDCLIRLNKSVDEASSMVRILRAMMAKGEAHVQSVDVVELMTDIQALLEAEAKQRGVLLQVLVRAQGLQVMAEPLMLQRTILNLVTNSFDAVLSEPTISPTIKLLIEPCHLDVGIGGLVVSVEDNGPGYPPEFLGQFGEPWMSQKISGLGVGLLLSKYLAEFWGGDLQVANRPAPERGARAHFRLRLA